MDQSIKKKVIYIELEGSLVIGERACVRVLHHPDVVDNRLGSRVAVTGEWVTTGIVLAIHDNGKFETARTFYTPLSGEEDPIIQLETEHEQAC